jgi:hypothetical protein
MVRHVIDEHRKAGPIGDHQDVVTLEKRWRQAVCSVRLEGGTEGRRVGPGAESNDVDSGQIRGGHPGRQLLHWNGSGRR